MTQTGYISVSPGVVSASLFTPGTDTFVAAAASITQGTNDRSFYTIVFNFLPGPYRLILKDADGYIMGIANILLADTTWEIIDTEVLGAYSVQVEVLLASNPVQGATVRLSRNGIYRTDTTDVNGIADLFVGSGTWTVDIYYPSATFNSTTLSVTTNVEQTYNLSASTIPIPEGPDLTTGYGLVLGQDSQPDEGVTVTMTLIAGVTDLHVATKLTEISDSNGMVYFTTLVRGASYLLRIGNGKNTVTVVAPDEDNFRLPTLI